MCSERRYQAKTHDAWSAQDLRGCFMITRSQLNRRSLLKTAAAGTAGLAAPQLFNINRTSAQEPVTIEYWNPGNDPVGGPIIQKLVDEFNATAGKDAGIMVHDVPTGRLHQIHDGDGEPELTGRCQHLQLQSLRPLDRQRVSAAHGSAVPGTRFEGRGLLPCRLGYGQFPGSHLGSGTR